MEEAAFEQVQRLQETSSRAEEQSPQADPGDTMFSVRMQWSSQANPDDSWLGTACLLIQFCYCAYMIDPVLGGNLCQTGSLYVAQTGLR